MTENRGDDDETETEPEPENEPYQATDLLPGLAQEDVWQTLYAITEQDLLITLGEVMAPDGNPYSYQVQGLSLIHI